MERWFGFLVISIGWFDDVEICKVRELPGGCLGRYLDFSPTVFTAITRY